MERLQPSASFYRNVDTLANSLKEVPLSTAEEGTGGDKGRRFNRGSQTRFWICATRDGSRNNSSKTSTEAGLEYRKVNREVRKAIEAANEEWSRSSARI